MSTRAPHRRNQAGPPLRDLLGPELPGRPACAGLAPMFDLTIDREPLDARHARHTAAVSVCSRCPVLIECGSVASAEQRPRGVWAGRVHDPAQRVTD